MQLTDWLIVTGLSLFIVFLFRKLNRVKQEAVLKEGSLHERIMQIKHEHQILEEKLPDLNKRKKRRHRD